MKTWGVIIVSIMLAVIGLGMTSSPVLADNDAIETGRLLAILLDSGRVTIAGVQALVNDPEKGDKGFTPDVLEQRMIAKFKERSGVDLTKLQSQKIPAQAKQLLPMLVESSKKVVATYQPIINKQGLGFKNFIPATFGTQAAAIFTARTGVYLKQTTSDEILRNPKNKADDFEAMIFRKFAEPSYPRQGDKVIGETVEGGKVARVMLPLYYGSKCLVCHGGPKDERDISGYLKEGKNEGDLGGAISVRLQAR
ncbi:MAG TPA: DUF3365 domain-containing protein [Nitrospirales bacterium]